MGLALNFLTNFNSKTIVTARRKRRHMVRVSRSQPTRVASPLVAKLTVTYPLLLLQGVVLTPMYLQHVNPTLANIIITTAVLVASALEGIYHCFRSWTTVVSVRKEGTIWTATLVVSIISRILIIAIVRSSVILTLK